MKLGITWSNEVPPTRSDLSEIGSDFVEVDAFALAHWPKRQPFELTVSASIWYLNGDDLIGTMERVDGLRELCIAHGALACIIKFSLIQSVASDFEQRVRAIIDHWSSLARCPVYFEPSKSVLDVNLGHELFVKDPLWQRLERPAPYWKIHGWHPERWVRRYSVEQLSELAAQASRFDPDFLVLAHSGRSEQMPDLRQAMGLFA